MRLANNSGSLLHDVDTNAAETYNSVVAKFVGGKRLNFSLKGSYEVRCKAAAVSYNTDGNFICTVLKRLSSSGTTGLHVEKFCERQSKARLIHRNGIYLLLFCFINELNNNIVYRKIDKK